MARSDLLISLAKAGTIGDQVLFRRTLEAIVAEERAKKHEVLADQLDKFLRINGNHVQTEQRTNQSTTVNDLFFEIYPRRSLGEMILSETVLSACHELIEEHARREILARTTSRPGIACCLQAHPGTARRHLPRRWRTL